MLKSVRLAAGLLVLGLLMLGTGLAHAQSTPDTDAEGTLRGFEGELIGDVVVLGEAGVMTIRDPRTGEERLIRMASNYGIPNFRVKVPGNPDNPNAMNPGAGVAVLARQVAGHWQAVEVLVKPDEPTMAPKTGVVIDSDPAEGTVTILSAGGDTHTLTLSSEESIPVDGDLVVAFTQPFKGEGASDSPADRQIVTGLARAVEVRERLSDHLEELTTSESDLEGGSPEVKANHVENLIELLDRQTVRHFERLEDALDHTSGGKQEAVISALIETGGAREEGKRKAQRVREALADEISRGPTGKDPSGSQGLGNDGSGGGKSGTTGAADSTRNAGNPKKGPGNSTGVLIDETAGSGDKVFKGRRSDETDDDDNQSADKTKSGSKGSGSANEAKEKVEKAAPNGGGSKGTGGNSGKGSSEKNGSGTVDKVKDAVDRATDSIGSGSDSSDSGSSGAGSDGSGSDGSGSDGSGSEGSGSEGSGSDGSGSDGSGSEGSGSDGSGTDSGSDSGGSDGSGTEDDGSSISDTVDDAVDTVEDVVDKVSGGLLP